MLRKRRCPLAGALDLLHFLDQRRPLFELAQHELAVPGDHRQEVIEVVGDAPRKPPDRLHLLRLAQPFLQFLPFGDVDEASAYQVAIRKRQSGQPHLAKKILPFRVVHRPLEQQCFSGQGTFDHLLHAFGGREPIRLLRCVIPRRSGSQELLAAASEKPFRIGIGVHEPFLRCVVHDDGVRSMLDQHAETAFAEVQFTVGFHEFPGFHVQFVQFPFQLRVQLLVPLQ